MDDKLCIEDNVEMIDALKQIKKLRKKNKALIKKLNASRQKNVENWEIHNFQSRQSDCCSYIYKVFCCF